MSPAIIPTYTQTGTFYSYLIQEHIAPVYVHSGQSNCGAYGELAEVSGRPELSSPITGVQMWQDASYTFETMHAGVNIPAVLDFGPELECMYLIRQQLNALGITKDIYCIKQYKSATGLVKDPTENTYHPDEDASNSFWDLVRQIRRVQTYLIEQGKIPFLAGFFWIQGEHDCALEWKSLAYQMAIEALYNGIFRATRIHGVSFPPFPFIDGLIRDVYGFSGNVRAGKSAFATNNPFAATCEMDDLTVIDNDHLDTASILTLGQREAASWSITGIPTNQS